MYPFYWRKIIFSFCLNIDWKSNLYAYPKRLRFSFIYLFIFFIRLSFVTRYDFPTDCNVLFEHFDETKESSNTENRIDCNECQPHSFKIYFFFIDTLRSIVGTNTHNLRIPSREINSIYRIQRAPRMFLFVCTRIVIASIRRNIMNDSIDSNLSKGDFDETERDRERMKIRIAQIYIF